MITDCHHSASLVMPIGDPRDSKFYPTLTLMIDSYITIVVVGFVFVVVVLLLVVLQVKCYLNAMFLSSWNKANIYLLL